MLQTFNFQHNASKVAQALGVNSQTEDRCIEIINFCTISNYLISHEMFDDRDDAPNNLTTLSGDLEKALSLVSTQEEKDYVLFMFRALHDAVQATITKYEMLNELQGVDKKKAELVLQMIELKLEEKTEESRDNYITPSSMFNRIKIVQQSNYNFQTYLTLLENNGKN